MSIRRGNSVIASSGANGLQIFDMKWSDHTIDDLNWISSHSNSYHSGNTYKKMYNHLVEDYHNGVDETEVIGSYTISYKLAPDGHKIVDSVSSGVVDNIYIATGIAWYYILDATNQQFKLPRTKYAFNSGNIEDLGKYISPGLPNITGSAGLLTDLNGGIGAFRTYKSGDYHSGTGDDSGTFDFDASRSSSIYGNSTTVQPPATSLLLYFYTNQFSVNSSSGGGTISIVYDDTNKRLIFGE